AELAYLSKIELHARRLADSLMLKAKRSTDGEIDARVLRALLRAGPLPSEIQEAAVAVRRLRDWSNTCRQGPVSESESPIESPETWLLASALPKVFSSVFSPA